MDFSSFVLCWSGQCTCVDPRYHARQARDQEFIGALAFPLSITPNRNALLLAMGSYSIDLPRAYHNISAQASLPPPAGCQDRNKHFPNSIAICSCHVLSGCMAMDYL